MSNQTYTPEQFETAKKAKSPEELIALAKGQGIEITSEQAAAFLKTPETYPLTDEELDNVAGGGCSGKPAYFEMAMEDGRQIHFNSFGGRIYPDLCGCDMDTVKESIFAREMGQNTDIYTLEHWHYGDCKCYACGKTWETLTVISYS